MSKNTVNLLAFSIANDSVKSLSISSTHKVDHWRMIRRAAAVSALALVGAPCFNWMPPSIKTFRHALASALKAAGCTRTSPQCPSRKWGAAAAASKTCV